MFEVSRIDDLCNGIFIKFSNFIIKCGLFFEEPLEMLSFDGGLIARFDCEEGADTIGKAFALEWKDFIRFHFLTPQVFRIFTLFNQFSNFFNYNGFVFFVGNTKPW